MAKVIIIFENNKHIKDFFEKKIIAYLKKRIIARSEKKHCSFRKESLFVLGNANSIENPPAQCRNKSEILQGGYII